MVRTIFVLPSFALAQDLFLQPLDAELEGHVHSCVASCLKDDRKKHLSHCEADGSTDCSKSKCCEVITDTCYVKNPYWSSCQPSCKKGHVDEEGEKWDCTGIAPTGCIHLQSCMAGCHSSLALSNSTLDDLEEIDGAEPEEDPELAEAIDTEDPQLEATGDPSKCTGGDKEVCKQSCKQSFKDNDYIEHVCEVLCEKNCPEHEKVCPNKKGLVSCLSDCKHTSTTTESGSKCEKDGATNCLHSKCCQQPGAKCYTKNPYWAACTSECEPGKKNPLDNMVWDCKEKKGKQVCDSYKYRKCASTCARDC
jgi:hypothetical protein